MRNLETVTADPGWGQPASLPRPLKGPKDANPRPSHPRVETRGYVPAPQGALALGLPRDVCQSMS